MTDGAKTPDGSRSISDRSPDQIMDAAADHLEFEGWCTGKLQDFKGNRCLIGGIAAELGMQEELNEVATYPSRRRFESAKAKIYNTFKKSEVAKILASEIAFEEEPGLSFEKYSPGGDSETLPGWVYGWNDSQKSKDPVIDLLRNAAKSYREKNS